MNNWRNYASLFFGALIGTFIFLVLAVFLVGSPISDALLSAHGVLVHKEKAELTAQQTFELHQLIKNGLVLTADGLLASIQTFYQSLINMLVGGLALLGVFSFFAIRSQTRAQIDDVVSDRTERGFEHLTESKSFHDMIENKLNIAMEIEREQIDSTFQALTELAGSIDNLSAARAEKADPEEKTKLTSERTSKESATAKRIVKRKK